MHSSLPIDPNKTAREKEKSLTKIDLNRLSFFKGKKSLNRVKKPVNNRRKKGTNNQDAKIIQENS